ncbi:MAG: AAA family ATPase [Candidatus Altiarchaeales archaeon]|nr:AAA family ATPase [Candidatus Altiarchaeales archaeon]MBD3416224.1 AAA family ATPase [Candidatus Altiarchaeales archaeon]
MAYDDYGELSLEHEYHNLANDYYKVGEFDKAIEHYNKALELRPDLLETYFNRGLAYTRKGMYDKALEDLNKVIELNPNLAEAYYTRGLVHEYKLEYDLGILDYNKALEVDPKYTKAETQRQVALNKKASLQAGGGYGGGAPAATPGAPGGQEGEGLTQFQVMQKPDMHFDDVAGLDKVKERIFDYIVYPLSNPELAKRYGKEAGGGVIMYGPPGCGKTYIAKASAGECESSFISVKMSDIVDMYAGNTEKNLHNAFETARENKPCILFFDEIDGIAGKREGMDQSFEKRAINQFLLEMDGAEYSNEGVLAIGATNAPWDIDAALRRSGRFSKTIFIGEPDTKTRREILKLHLKKRPYSKKLPIGRIARMTEGYSPADLASLVDEAATIPWKEAIKTGKERVITFRDFLKATAGEDAVQPSLPAWYGSVKKKLIEDEDDEEDDKYKHGFLRGVFLDIISLETPDSQSQPGSRSQTVKHKKEQEELLEEEDRRLFSHLIKDIEKRTDGLYQMTRKMRIMFARHVM